MIAPMMNLVMIRGENQTGSLEPLCKERRPVAMGPLVKEIRRAGAERKTEKSAVKEKRFRSAGAGSADPPRSQQGWNQHDVVTAVLLEESVFGDSPRLAMMIAEGLDERRAQNRRRFIEERIGKLEILLNMITDKEWQLDDDERKAILSALSYFAEPDDLIPDSIPGIGFLDDALYAEIILQELEDEVRTYTEFCQFRIAEENRRRNSGRDPYVGREDWLADKRAVLHSRMRARRSGGPRTSGRWRVGLF